jgi:single-strand DNA-binding protein
MSSVNKAIIIGNLGADPDVRTTGSGTKVATLSIATSETFNDRDGNRQERTEWHRVVCWDKLAELAERYLAKGRKVYVEGKLQTREWEKDGVKRYSTEIVCDPRGLTFLDKGSDSGGSTAGGGGYGAQGGGGGYGHQSRPQTQQTATQPRAVSTQQPAQPEFMDDDIPF